MLSGSVVVVTGAASGIGRATCELLLRTRDVKVVGVDLLAKDRKSGESLGRLLSTGRFELLQGDITDDKFRHTIASYVEGLGRCQGLVNAAGVYRLYAFPELTEKQLKLSMEVNFYAPLWLTRHLLPHLKAASPASVVNVTSCDRGAPGRTAYCSSKGALSSWTRVMAAECGPADIRFNAVSPGIVDTAMTTTDVPIIADDRDGLIKAIPLRRVAVPEDVAKVIDFLLSADAAYINGATIPVDGGQSSTSDGGWWE